MMVTYKTLLYFYSCIYTASSEVLDVEAPVYSGLELYNVTVTAQLCIETLICVDVPNTTVSNNCQPCLSSPCTNILPQRLNLCQNNYTIVAYAMDSTVQASTVVTGDSDSFVNGLLALSEVANIQSSSSSLLWSPPANRPEDCIAGYEISWVGGSFIHSPSNEDMPSVSFDVLKGNGFPVCQTVDITISPFLPALGVLRNKAANFTGLVIPGMFHQHFSYSKFKGINFDCFTSLCTHTHTYTLGSEGLPGLGYSGAIAVSVIIPSLVTFFLGLVIGTAVTFCCSSLRQHKAELTNEKSKDGEQEQSMI